MKILSLLIIIVLSAHFISVNSAFAQCTEDKDWPDKPCNDAINLGDPNHKPILGDKQDWQVFYNMKGKD